MLKALGTLCLCLGVVTVVAADDQAAKLDPAKLVGDWVYVAGMRSGDKVDKERLAGKVIISKETITLPAGPDQKFVIAYKLDTSKSPVAIDLDIQSGPVNEGKALGIIELKNGELKLCYVPDLGGGAKRPEKFESTKENQAFLFTLKKEQ